MRAQERSKKAFGFQANAKGKKIIWTHLLSKERYKAATGPQECTWWGKKKRAIKNEFPLKGSYDDGRLSILSNTEDTHAYTKKQEYK